MFVSSLYGCDSNETSLYGQLPFSTAQNPKRISDGGYPVTRHQPVDTAAQSRNICFHPPQQQQIHQQDHSQDFRRLSNLSSAHPSPSSPPIPARSAANNKTGSSIPAQTPLQTFQCGGQHFEDENDYTLSSVMSSSACSTSFAGSCSSPTPVLTESARSTIVEITSNESLDKTNGVFLTNKGENNAFRMSALPNEGFSVL